MREAKDIQATFFKKGQNSLNAFELNMIWIATF